MKVGVSGEKDVNKAMCLNGIEENKSRYKNMKNKGRKMFLKAMREIVGEGFTELKIVQTGCLRY